MITFRPCTLEDSSTVIPLMFSAGPAAYRYVFSVTSNDQVLEFLEYAYKNGRGEFGYQDHQVAIKAGQVVGLVGKRSHLTNTVYTISAIKAILGFYGILNGFKVIVRGLRFERIVKPPQKGVLCLHNLAISESFRGQGVGRQLITHFIEQAQNENENENENENAKTKTKTKAIGLDVAKSNPHAQALYQHLGFQVISHNTGSLVNKYGMGNDHVYMEFKL
ncbi:MAG: GNAT family N-acetyltransferase [Colwellia sp.]|nr:GNAT family N-acetyltransferase [Colwellia sp.]